MDTSLTGLASRSALALIFQGQRRLCRKHHLDIDEMNEADVNRRVLLRERDFELERLDCVLVDRIHLSLSCY